MPCEYLTNDELHSGCKLLLDTGADTCVTGKYAWLGEVIESFTSNARGFDDASQALENLPIDSRHPEDTLDIGTSWALTQSFTQIPYSLI